MKFMTRAAAAMLIAIGCAGGCARLTIDVDAYQGDLVHGPGTQLAVAVGSAKFIYGETQKYQAILTARGEPADSGVMKQLTLLQDTYTGAGSENPGIEALWKTAQTASNEADAKAKIASLTSQLIHFGQVSVGTGQTIGLPGTYHWTIEILHSKKLQQDLEAGVSMEESGRKIILLCDNVQRPQDDRTEISSLMQSDSRGMVLSRLYPRTDLTQALIKGENWRQINQITVDAQGDANYVVVKDDVGNWHIKTVQNDPQEVVAAINDGILASIKVLAAVSGVPGVFSAAASGTGGSNGGAEQAGKDDASLQGGRAERAAAQLRAARDSLRSALKDAKTQSDGDKQLAAAKSAVAAYVAALNRIQPISEASSQPPVPTNTPAPAPAPAEPPSTEPTTPVSPPATSPIP